MDAADLCTEEVASYGIIGGRRRHDDHARV
jgi:hypothetical protein